MSVTNLAAERQNFLLPNGTIIVESIIFVIVLYVLWRYVVPPVRKAMRDRNEMVQRQIEESRKAEERFAAAEQRHREALNEARSEAGKIRDAARADGQRVLEELRGQAGDEVAELRRAGEEQLAAQRARVVDELRPQVAELSRVLASRIVGEDVAAAGGGGRGRRGR